ncbi:MAG: outer membrane beta-barrel domain-containing protein [Bdellovibrionales bacterium]|nr:outer membrane beta-barrel domain-containing protein [Bdellovibrionales bacterium]
MRALLWAMIGAAFFNAPGAWAEQDGAAEAQPAPAAQASSGDEYDFSWLDPEKKIYVVQNRKYVKKHRMDLAVGVGPGVGEPYRTRSVMNMRGSFFFSENLGIEGSAFFVKNRENNNFGDLKAVSSTFPTVRDIQYFYGGSLVWAPFYGKLNIFNKILYLDWLFSVGVGTLRSEIDLNTSSSGRPLVQETNHTGWMFGTGHKYWVSRNFAVRLDYNVIFYRADTSLRGVTSGVVQTYDNHFVTAGLSWTF